MKTNHKVIKNIKTKNNKNRNSKSISLYEPLINLAANKVLQNENHRYLYLSRLDIINASVKNSKLE